MDTENIRKIGISPGQKIGGSRIQRIKIKRSRTYRMDEYKNKIDAFLYTTEHLNVNNKIKNIEITFNNRKRLILDKPNNYSNTSKDYSIRYIKDANCFVINRHRLKEIEEYASLDFEIPDPGMMSRKGNHYERRLKSEFIKKCMFKECKEQVASIVFHLDDGTIWELDGPELYYGGKYFYLINGSIDKNIHTSAGQKILFDPERDRAKSRSERRKRSRLMSRKQRDSLINERLRSNSRSRSRSKSNSRSKSQHTSMSSGRQKRQ